MILKFGLTIDNLKELILAKSPPLHKLKSILGLSYRALKPRLSMCNCVGDVLEIIEEKCSLLNLSCMKAITERFQIKDANDCIKSYNAALSEFCKSIRLTPCIGRHFLKFNSAISSQPLKCETVKFILSWKTDEYTLDDINELLYKAFEDLAEDVIVVDMKTGNSIILTCFSPHTITSLLILIAQRNLSILTEDGVISLSIGYCVVLEYTETKKVYMNE